jgi:hypothetical protein
MLVAIIAAPALLGTQEAIRQSQSKEKREEHRARRCNLIASCVTSSLRSREINGRPVVLRNGKVCCVFYPYNSMSFVDILTLTSYGSIQAAAMARLSAIHTLAIIFPTRTATMKAS